MVHMSTAMRLGLNNSIITIRLLASVQHRSTSSQLMPSTSAYMDDIFIHSEDPAEHDELVHKVLHRLQDAGLKSQFWVTHDQVSWLYRQHHWSPGRSILPSKVSCIFD